MTEASTMSVLTKTTEDLTTIVLKEISMTARIEATITTDKIEVLITTDKIEATTTTDKIEATITTDKIEALITTDKIEALTTTDKIESITMTDKIEDLIKMIVVLKTLTLEKIEIKIMIAMIEDSIKKEEDLTVDSIKEKLPKVRNPTFLMNPLPIENPKTGILLKKLIF